MALPFYAFPIKCYFKISFELTISRYYFISMEVSLLFCYQLIHSSIVLIRNRLNEPLVRQRIRPRRNRKSEAVRAMIRENIVTPKCVLSYDSKRLTFEEGFKHNHRVLRDRDFIYPLFIHEADYKEEISSMPDCFRLSLNAMMDEVAEAIRYYIFNAATYLLILPLLLTLTIPLILPS